MGTPILTPKQKIIRELIQKIDDNYQIMIEHGPDPIEVDKSLKFQELHDMKGWEVFFNPEHWFYQEIYEKLSSEDVVYDVGAGDLRFDLWLSEKVKRIYAVEIQPAILAPALQIIGYDLPKNLIVICGNAFDLPLPSDVTTIICLMIHRQTNFPAQWLKKRIIYTLKHEVIDTGQR